SVYLAGYAGHMDEETASRLFHERQPVSRNRPSERLGLPRGASGWVRQPSTEGGLRPCCARRRRCSAGSTASGTSTERATPRASARQSRSQTDRRLHAKTSQTSFGPAMLLHNRLAPRRSEARNRRSPTRARQ